jgi:hypothetical protein
MATGGDSRPDIHIHSDINSSNKTLLKSEALYQVKSNTLTHTSYVSPPSVHTSYMFFLSARDCQELFLF